MIIAYGPRGWRAWLSAAAAAFVLFLTGVMILAALSTQDPVVGSIGLIALVLLAWVARPWAVLLGGRVWRSPSLGLPLLATRVSNVRADGFRLDVEIAGEWHTVATIPYAAWGPLDTGDEEDRLRRLFESQ